MNDRRTDAEPGQNHSTQADRPWQMEGADPAGKTRLRIREMREEDLIQVEQIERQNFSRPWSEQDFRDFLVREDAVFLTALLNGEVAGYIGFYGIPDEGDITNVSVDDRFRRLGIGRALVLALIDRAAGRGIGTIFLEVRDSNEAAIRLYEQAGFVQVGLRKRYYSSPQEDARIMRYPAPDAR